MLLPVEYSWLEFYLENDSLWFEDSVNWENILDTTFNEFTFYSFLTSSFFFNNYIFIDSHIKFSFLDMLLIFETDKKFKTKEFYNFFIWDLIYIIYNKLFFLQFLFFSDYQDFITIILYYSPELILSLIDYMNVYWINNTINNNTSVVYDLFSDNLNSSISEFVEYFILFVFYVWFIILFINIFQLMKINNANETYLNKLYFYFWSIAKESRIQFEAMLQTVFFFFFYWTMMIATFDDDNEELIETFDSGCFIFFILIIAYLCFKYSQHYFAFLEASVSEGKSVAFISKQFFRDFINTFALLLRFFILLFRLNVYDTLDDFYDSYYIFAGDFDDDEYLNELFISFNNLLFFDTDNNDDRIYSLEEENDFFMDLFYLYFLCWAKFFMFIFFILEEILRLSLAFYICYLITFDVHAVNLSYNEENFIQSKLNAFKKEKKISTNYNIKL